ncbi:MAG: hypothetical protein BWK78_01875 [Thiotrichaceae bacterium IS1]|nr:MAG: hypothetical protein BWK78_01875 [Thiotrichaceae bacterium IS1]
MEKLLIEPSGLAINTRKAEQGSNYDWCVQTGTCQLLEDAKRIYTTALCEVGALDSAKFAVLRKNARLGLLIADMPTLRVNFAGGPISTTLYLEFASNEPAILNAATHLLRSSNWDVPQIFCNYAEDAFKNPDSSIKPLQLLLVNIPSGQVTKKAGLVFSSAGNRDQYASYLTRIPNNFCFISTGYVGLNPYQELESILGGKLLLLTTKELEPSPTCWIWKNLIPALIVLALVSFVSYQMGSGSVQSTAYQKAQQVQQTQSESTKEKSSELENAIQLKEKEKSDLQSQLKQQTKQVQELREGKDAEILTLKQQKAEADKRIGELETQLTSLVQEVEELRKANRQLEPPSSFGIDEIDRAVNDLQHFLRQRAVNNQGKTTEEKTLEEFLRMNSDDPNSYYIRKYCPDFLAKRQTLAKAIEKYAGSLLFVPVLPENYCDEY